MAAAQPSFARAILDLGLADLDARTVAQRFDLQGECKLAVPLTLDLETRKMRWLDAKFTSHGIQHQVAGYRAALAALGRDFDAYFGAGTRPSMWELACIHAAARTREVVVRQSDGKAQLLRRGDDETTHAFYRRLRATTPSEAAVDLPASPDPVLFAALLDDLPLPAGSLGYALRWLASTPVTPRPAAPTTPSAGSESPPREPEGVHRLAASDLLAALAR